MDATTKILVLAGEDWTGLWDAPLDLSDELQPEEAARLSLQQLVSDGLVEMFAGNLDDDDPAVLDRDQALEYLRPGPQWGAPKPDEPGPLVYFSATPAGIDWLNEHHWGVTQGEGPRP